MKLGAIFVLILIGVPAFFIGWSIQTDIDVTNNISAWYDRASTAPTAGRMAHFLDELTASMEEYGMTSGYAALVYKNPQNDMAVIYPLLHELRDRAIEVEQYPHGSMDYAESMGELKLRMQDFEFNPVWWYCVNRTPSAVLAWWPIAYLILLGPLVLLAIRTWDLDIRCVLGKHKWNRQGECVRCGVSDCSWTLRDELEVKTPDGMAKIVVSTVPWEFSKQVPKANETTVSGTVGDKKLIPYQEKNWGRRDAVRRHDEIMDKLRKGKFILGKAEGVR